MLISVWIGLASAAELYMPAMTSPEIQAAMDAGKRTVLIPTGGIEQNGPYLTLDKHQLIAREVAIRTAERLGDALVAPVIDLVPEGRWAPRTGHMQFAGTVGLSEDTFRSVLSDVAASYRAQGFEQIAFLGDSGGNQSVQESLAESLDLHWSNVRVHHVAAFYDPEANLAFLEERGVRWTADAHHDDPAWTFQVLAIDPVAARLSERNGAETDGLVLDARSAELGDELLTWRAEQTAAAITDLRQTPAPSWTRTIGRVLLFPFLALVDPASRVYWLYVVSSLLLAFVVIAWRQGRGWTVGSVGRSLFPRDILTSPDARNDLVWTLCGGAFLFATVAGISILIEAPLTNWLLDWLTVVPSPMLPRSAGLMVATTIAWLLVADFAVWLAHYLQHRIPILWTFHKTHHAAVQMTPLTLFRQHPVDLLGAGVAAGFFRAGYIASVIWLTGEYPGQWGVAGVNIVVVLSLVAGYQLRHSHVWLSFGPLNRVFISPAMHQIHHSVDPRHHDKNMGLILSVWDVAFGTAFIPETEEKLEFGIGEDGAPFNSAWAFFWHPFREVFDRSPNDTHR